MSKKAGIVIGTILALVVAVAAGCVILMGGKDEAYRSIMVYQVNGNATITRERVGEMAAYENLMLQSGDSVAVASESSMRLKLDDDKYLLAEQDTLMNIVAEGDDADAKTYIDLKQGSVTSEIQNKLGANATYEVNTPNSIMAVRGTIFRVEVTKNESGDTDTRLTVFEGTVSARAVMPDGTVSDEEVMVGAGQELNVQGTVMSFSDLGEPTDADYESLPQVLQEYIEELGIDTAKNTKATEEREQQPAQEKAQGVQQPAQEADQQEEEAQTALGQQDTEEKPEADEQERAENTPNSQSKASEKTPKQQPSKSHDEETKQEPEQGLEEQPQTQPQDVMPPETQPPKTQPQSQPQASEPNKDSSSEGQSGGGGKKKTQYYTVTFQYNGSTFGTQKVKKGEKAEEPKLSPTENGAWDYDFSTKVNKNLTVQWIEK